MHLIIGGCGRLGAEIATRLSSDPDLDVVVVDTDPRAFDRLGPSFNGETVAGSCADRLVLARAGVAHADGLLAVTRSDNANLMSVQMATHLYDVPRTIARLFDPARERVYRQLGIRYVSSTSMIATTFLNEFREDAFPLHVAFEDVDFGIVELEVAPDGAGTRIADLEAGRELRVAAIMRGDRILIPDAEERLVAGDVLTAALGPDAGRTLDGIVVAPFTSDVQRRRAR
jgi:trk system potassium uptake protein TrkA